MRINIEGGTIPYPLTILKGYLRIAGVTRIDSEKILDIVSSQIRITNPSEQSILNECKSLLEHSVPHCVEDFEIISRYNWFLRKDKLPHIILVLEGASATGKSMLAMNMIPTLAATRFVTTDSIRQILRTSEDPEKKPELFCHTYQAYKYKQIGPTKLTPPVRGYLAQTGMIFPTVAETTKRLFKEGVSAVIEGVHIVPGSLMKLSDCIIEILIHPDNDTHWNMFKNKAEGSGLKTVSDNLDSRHDEYTATREIQDYLENQAKENEVPIVELESYEETEDNIDRVIFDHISELVDALSNQE
jgi:2-phosphoglycerate kinase